MADTSTVQPWPAYSSEREFVDDLEAACQEVGWSTAREVPIRLLTGGIWGRIDLLAAPPPSSDKGSRPRPILVEAKLEIDSMATLRGAVQQAHGYAGAFGVPTRTMVVASAVDYDVPRAFINETYNLIVVDGQSFEERIYAASLGHLSLLHSVYLGEDLEFERNLDQPSMLAEETLFRSNFDEFTGSLRGARPIVGTKAESTNDLGRQARKAWREQRGHDPSDDYDFPVTVRKAEDGAA